MSRNLNRLSSIDHQAILEMLYLGLTELTILYAAFIIAGAPPGIWMLVLPMIIVITMMIAGVLGAVISNYHRTHGG